jgi:hypothetical protein
MVKAKPLATAKRKITAAHCRTNKVTKAKSKTAAKGTVMSRGRQPAGNSHWGED